MPRFQLRACSPADLELTYEITKQAMAGYVQETWGTWEDQEQIQKHREDFTPETHELVVVSGQTAGLIARELEPGHIWLVKLYLLPAYRNMGLGSAVLAHVLQEAHALGKLVRLRVLRVNTRAKRFYERHGFKVVREAPERFFMESGA